MTDYSLLFQFLSDRRDRRYVLAEIAALLGVSDARALEIARTHYTQTSRLLNGDLRERDIEFVEERLGEIQDRGTYRFHVLQLIAYALRTGIFPEPVACQLRKRTPVRNAVAEYVSCQKRHAHRATLPRVLPSLTLDDQGLLVN